MIITLLFSVVLGLIALLSVTVPVIYFGVSHLTNNELVACDSKITYQRSVMIAAVGTATWGLLHIFFGWIPLIGVFLSPLAWIYVLKRFTTIDWPIATVIGVSTWALSSLAYQGLVILLF